MYQFLDALVTIVQISNTYWPVLPDAELQSRPLVRTNVCTYSPRFIETVWQDQSKKMSRSAIVPLRLNNDDVHFISPYLG